MIFLDENTGFVTLDRPIDPLKPVEDVHHFHCLRYKRVSKLTTESIVEMWIKAKCHYWYEF